MASIDEATRQPWPGVLFHYTSFETFNRILETRTLRLYSFNTMNDTSEGRWIEPIIQEFLQRNQISPSIQQLFWTQYTLNRSASIRYLFCLSRQGNALGQWILYAQNGKGISVGFDFDQSRVDITLPGQLVHAFHSVGLYPVLYDPREQTSIVQEITKRLNSAVSESEAEIITAIQETASALVRLAIAFKSDGFRGEEEWRLIDNPTPLMGLKTVPGIHEAASSEIGFNYDIRGNSARDFVELKLDDVLVHGMNDIVQVVLGPDSKITEETMRDYLRLKGLLKIQVTRSKIPYRGATP